MCWNKRDKKWEAKLEINGLTKHLGKFPKDQEEDAARAYDQAAMLWFGEFAKTNF